jgi:NTP pyrophosphatase (non-canonical NTP hydrolase)
MSIENLNNYQQLADRTAKHGDFNFDLMHAALGLTGEAGEFADCIKKHLVYGKELDRVNAKEELGDLLWFVALAATTLGVDLQTLAEENIEKLSKRYPEKYSDELAGKRLDKIEAEVLLKGQVVEVPKVEPWKSSCN